MKDLMIFFVSLMGMLLMAYASGCMDKNGNIYLDVGDSEISTETNEHYSDIIPNPVDFFSSEITILDEDGEDAYIIQILNAEEASFDAYVSACISKGFTEISYDENEAFGAYTNDGKYWVEVNIDDQMTVTILCQKSKNYEEVSP